MATQISTSTSADATNVLSGKNVLLASDGTAVAFYFNGSNLVFRTAAGPAPYSSWSAETAVGASGREGSAAVLNGDDSIWLATHDVNGNVQVAKLTKSGSSWTVGSQNGVGFAQPTFNTSAALSLVKDGSGRLWCVGMATTTTWVAYYSTDGVSWTASLTGAAKSSTANDPAAVVAGNFLVVCYCKSTQGLLAYRRLDTTGALGSGNWSAETTVSAEGGNAFAGDALSLAADGSGRAVLVLSSAGFNFASGVWGMVYTPGSDTWANATQLGTHTGANQDVTGFAVRAANAAGDVFALYGQNNGSASTYALVTKRWHAGSATWDGAATTLEAAAAGLVNPNAYATNTTVAYAYTQNTATPWAVEFDTYAFATHNLHNAGGASVQTKAHVAHNAGGAVVQLPSMHQTHRSGGANLAIAKIPPTYPVISRGQPAYAVAGSFNPTFANDGDYGTLWNSVLVPSVGTPAWWAVDLSAVPLSQRQQVVLHVLNDGVAYYQPASPTYNNLPQNYTIQTNSAPGGTYPTTGWQTAVTVTGNVYSTRSHVFNLAGANWVQVVCTASLGTSPNNTVVWQIDVHDAHQGNVDHWLLLGDSITEEATGARNIDGSSWVGGPIYQAINAAYPAFFPVMLDGGNPTQTTGWGATYINAMLAPFGGHYVSVAFGTNDLNQLFQFDSAHLQSLWASLKTILNAIVAAGMTPVVPYVPYGTAAGGFLGTNALLWNQYVSAHLPVEYPTALRGPDLWTPFFLNDWNGHTLLRDGIHPTYAEGAIPGATGYDLYRRVWRDWVLTNIYKTPPPSHVAGGATVQASVTGGKARTYHTVGGAHLQVFASPAGQSPGVSGALVTHTTGGSHVAARFRNFHQSGGAHVQSRAHFAHQSGGAHVQAKWHLTHQSGGAHVQAFRALPGPIGLTLTLLVDGRLALN